MAIPDEILHASDRMREWLGELEARAAPARALETMPEGRRRLSRKAAGG